MINPKEAPNGYYAIEKPKYIHGVSKNICEQCDWRKTCCDKNTDFTLYGNKCMSYETAYSDGRTIKRQDGCSVIFKKEIKDVC